MVERGQSIAGAGSSRTLRIASRLAEDYGGRPNDWAKKTSTSYTGRDGYTFEVHWYENVATGLRVEYKTKFPPASHLGYLP